MTDKIITLIRFATVPQGDVGTEPTPIGLTPFSSYV